MQATRKRTSGYGTYLMIVQVRKSACTRLTILGPTSNKEKCMVQLLQDDMYRSRLQQKP